MAEKVGRVELSREKRMGRHVHRRAKIRDRREFLRAAWRGFLGSPCSHAFQFVLFSTGWNVGSCGTVVKVEWGVREL